MLQTFFFLSKVEAMVTWLQMIIQQLRLRLLMMRIRQNLLLLALLNLVEEDARGRRNRRSYWVRPWIQRRPMFGQYEKLMHELMDEAHGDFKHYLRMPPNMFMELLHRVSPRITKKWRRQPLEPGLKLAITLPFLATGCSYAALEFDFRVAHNTISLFVPEVCKALVDEFASEVLAIPNTPDEWNDVSMKFGSRWNFHHACGAIDGKHIAIKQPPKSGTMFYKSAAAATDNNYKGFYSVVLLAVVDADYKFLWASIGAPGSNSDAGVFNESSLESDLREGRLGLPDASPLPNDDHPVPYFLIGDNAFPHCNWMQTPFSQQALTYEERIFYYRLSRARRVVENAFGILACRWRCLLTTLQTQHLTVRCIVKACLVLHNIMRVRYPQLQNQDLDEEDEQGNVIPGLWRDNRVLADVELAARAPRATREGHKVRTYLKHYYSSPVGAVTWQDAAIDNRN